jgi:hypothetical protein
MTENKLRRISHPVPSPSTELVDNPNNNDILLGRGGYNNKFVGNEQLREFAMEYVTEYLDSTKSKKTRLAKALVNRIRSLDPPGRFLKKLDNGQWMDIGDDLARDKASQVLRDAVRDVPEYQEVRQRRLDTASQKKADTSLPRENPNKQDILRFCVGSDVVSAAASARQQEHMLSSFGSAFPTYFPHSESVVPRNVTTKKRPHSEILSGESVNHHQNHSNSSSTIRYPAPAITSSMDTVVLNKAVPSPSHFKGNMIQMKSSPVGSSASHKVVPFLHPSDPNFFNFMQPVPFLDDQKKQRVIDADQNIFNSNPQYYSQAHNTGLLQMRLESLRQRYLHEIKSEINSYETLGTISQPNLTFSKSHKETFLTYLQAQQQMLHEQKLSNLGHLPETVASQSNQTSEFTEKQIEPAVDMLHRQKRILPLNRQNNLKNISCPPSVPEAVVEKTNSKKTQSDEGDDSRLKLLCATIECVENL